MFTANIAANHVLSCSTLAMRAQQANRVGSKLNGVGAECGGDETVRAKITLKSSVFTGEQIKDIINEINQVIED